MVVQEELSPLVSVIIPCYNAEKYVEMAVRSIMQQTYRKLEIIVIDDCSTDSTLSILASLLGQDERIKFFRNNSNLKIVATLNRGIAAATGKYIARMDADDISLPERIQLQVNFMENNSDIMVCGGQCLKIDEQGQINGKIKYTTNSDELKAELLFFCPFAHPAVMIRKEIFNRRKLYKEGMAPAEDYELWLNIAESGELANLPDYLIKYRWHGNNATIKQKGEQATVLYKVLESHASSFGFAEEYLSFHLKFLEGTWNRRSGINEISVFRTWKRELEKKNFTKKFFNEKALRKVFDKYMSLAMLSIIKSKENSLQLKMIAIGKLLSINPTATLANVAERL